MAKVTVEAGVLGLVYHGVETTLKLRVYNKKTFIPSTGETVLGTMIRSSVFYQQINCTVVNGRVHYAEFIIDSTTDAHSNSHDTAYSFLLYTNAGVFVSQVHKNVRIAPDTPATLGALVLFSEAQERAVDDDVYTAEEVESRIAEALAGITSYAPPATIDQRGNVLLDTDPVDPLFPTAVAINSPLIERDLANFYGNDLAALEAETEEVRVIVRQPVTASDPHIFPSNVRLAVLPGGLITVDGVTITVNNLEDPDDYQIFEMADASSHVLYGPLAAPMFNVRWSTPTASMDLRHAMDDCLASCDANGNGRVRVPAGAWTSAGGHVIPTRTHIYGDGNNSSVITHTTGQVFNQADDDANICNFMFKIGNGTLWNEIHDLQIFGIRGFLEPNADTQRWLTGDDFSDHSSMSNSIGLLCQGTAPNTSGFLKLCGVIIANFHWGWRIKSDGGWQFANAKGDRASALLYNDIDFAQDTPNTNVTFDGFVGSSYIGIPADNTYGATTEYSQWSGDLAHSGPMTFTGEFAGGGIYGHPDVASVLIPGPDAVTLGGTVHLRVTSNKFPASNGFTFTDANVNTGTDTIAVAGHTFVNGDVVKLHQAATLPAPLALNTPYYVVGAVATVSVQLSLTPGGSPINLTTVGTAGSNYIGTIYSDIYVDLSTTDHTTGVLISEAYRQAIASDPLVSQYFHVGYAYPFFGWGTNGTSDIKLVSLDCAKYSERDTVLNLSIDVGTVTGTSSSPTSTYLPSKQQRLANGFYLHGNHGPISFERSADEGFDSFIYQDTDSASAQISFNRWQLQSKVQLQQGCSLLTEQCNVFDKSIRSGVGGGISGAPVYTSIADTGQDQSNYWVGLNVMTFTQANVNVATNTFTVNSHLRSNGDVIKLDQVGQIPAPLQKGTGYYIVNKTANTFQLAATAGGAVIDITNTGTAGTSTIETESQLLLVTTNPRTNNFSNVDDSHRGIVALSVSPTEGRLLTNLPAMFSRQGTEWLQYPALRRYAPLNAMNSQVTNGDPTHVYADQWNFFLGTPNGLGLPQYGFHYRYRSEGFQEIANNQDAAYNSTRYTGSVFARGFNPDYFDVAIPLTGTVNDLDMHTFYDYGVIRIPCSATATLTGLKAPIVGNGRVISVQGTGHDSYRGTLVNPSAFAITIKNQDAGSSAVNRFITPGGVDFIFAPGTITEIWYDPAVSRWRLGQATNNAPTVVTKAVDYTLLFSDRQVIQTGAGRTNTIPANASVAYPIGTELVFRATDVGGTTIAITTDTMTLANSVLTGPRTLAQNGVARAFKMTATTWLIDGVGLT